MEELKLETSAALSDLEVRILDFERQWWRYAGAKETGIKEQFNLSAREYYELSRQIDVVAN